MIDPARLSAIPLFRGFDERALAGIASFIQVLRFDDGDLVVEQGSREGGCYIVLRGQVRLFRTTPDGSAVDLVTLGPGALFGLLTVLDGLPRAASGAARGEVEVAELSFAAFSELMDGRGATALRFQVAVCQELVKDIRAANLRLAELASLPSQEVSMVSIGGALAPLK
ncbi:MAG: cyclic nucleotide-binding domain-containing protein [Deltaproteobacteria bacterium]|nr:cyclic nucleotide-binding domain-containing protein [Deltaproteobacteria bacterium]